MIRTTIRVRDTLTPAMAAAGAQIKPGRCAKIASRIAEGVFVAHFEKLSRERHRSGMAHDFYLQAARATYSQASGSEAVVAVRAPTGLRQRFRGGLIKPVKIFKLRGGRTYSALWIPVGEAVGRTGGDFRGKLAVLWNARKQKGVAIDKTSKAVLFSLVESVNQEPDPSVAPDTFDLRKAVLSGLTNKLETAWKRSQAEE